MVLVVKQLVKSQIFGEDRVNYIFKQADLIVAAKHQRVDNESSQKKLGIEPKQVEIKSAIMVLNMYEL